MTTDKKQISTHQGFPVYFTPPQYEGDEPGYSWQEGGYFDTIEECKADIADWNKAELRSEREEFGYPDDTPSVTPWYANA